VDADSFEPPERGGGLFEATLRQTEAP